MVLDNTYYKLYIEQGKQYLVNKILGTSTLTAELFLYSDKNFSNPLETKVLDYDEEYIITLCSEDRYILRLTYNTTEIDTYELVCYTFFETEFLKGLKSYLCSCTNKNILNNCSDCIDDDKNIDIFSFQIFSEYYLNLFTEQNFSDNLHKYLYSLFKTFEIYLEQRYVDMFWNKKIRGNYLSNINSVLLYFAGIYTYMYFTELLTDTDADYVNTKYEIDDLKICLYKLGLNFSNFADSFSNTSAFGNFALIEDISAVSDICNISEVINTGNISKETYTVTGKDIEITSVPKTLVFIIPKMWGNVTGITDAAGSNLITDTTLHDCTNYNIYVFNYVLPPNTYNFKITTE